jgi:hypothetical protein
MNPMTVNISGNFTEKLRPNNGMEKVGPFLNANRLVRVPVVAYCEWHGHAESRTGDKVAVIVPAIEPGITATGGPVPGLPVHDGFPTDAAGQIMWLLDSIRRADGKGAVADTLFGVPSSEIHRDEDDELEGQQALPLEQPETRLGADGPREVPPPSGEELTAELDERRAATGLTRAEQTRKAVTGSSAPVAAFSAPDGGDAA